MHEMTHVVIEVMDGGEAVVLPVSARSVVVEPCLNPNRDGSKIVARVSYVVPVVVVDHSVGGVMVSSDDNYEPDDDDLQEC